MRTEAEIDAAIAQLTEAFDPRATKPGPLETITLASVFDVLLWVRGEKSNFMELLIDLASNHAEIDAATKPN